MTQQSTAGLERSLNVFLFAASGLRARLLIVTLVATLVSFAGFLGGCASKPDISASHVDKVVVRKGDRQMDLLKDGAIYRSYRISLGDSPRGHKMQEGDERTPEGDYILDWRNPRSSFHKSIHVSYPNTRDRAFARAMGFSPGGMIMIHGRPNWLTSSKVAKEYDGRDWTNGCIAVTNPEMDEIWRLVRNGTPIRILP
ncbi:MAG: L,D-transpeptidase family protein [Thiohalocapsa sp.]